MAIEYKIKDEKLQYDINREVAKISALSLENWQISISYMWTKIKF